MSDEPDLPEGYDPDVYEDLGEFLEDNGYELVEDGNGQAYQHPDTGHTIRLSQSGIPQAEYEPGDDMEM